VYEALSNRKEVIDVIVDGYRTRQSEPAFKRA
jgi:hypothetical protein